MAVPVKNVVTGVIGSVDESTADLLDGDWVRVEDEPKRKPGRPAKSE